MFVVNQQHLQVHLFSTLDELPKKVREMLENSWAGTFRREVFGRLDERPFAVLYADVDSRPNTPVNVLMGLDALRTGFGWTNEEMYEAFQFNLQVRYALGYENLGEGYFTLRTLYNFRNRLSKHMQETGENLIEKAFEQVTDEQIAALALVTTDLRVDSTQIASDICTISRLQLLAAFLAQPGNPRAAVESTVRSVKQPFRHGKVLVRGLFRVACALLSSAFMVNARRLHRLATQKRQNPTPSNPNSSVFVFFGLLHPLFISTLTSCWRFQPTTLRLTVALPSSPFSATQSLVVFD